MVNKKREVRYIYMVLFQKWPFFDLLVNKGRKRTKIDPKNGSKNVWYFLPVPRFFEILVPGIFSKPVFCPSPNWFIFHFFQYRDFSKNLRTGKSRYWKKWKTCFFPVSPIDCMFLVVESVLVAEKNTFFPRLPYGFLSILLLWLASPKTHRGFR